MTNDELADWIEARCGRRPDATTLWNYRRGVVSHSLEGRRKISSVAGAAFGCMQNGSDGSDP